MFAYPTGRLINASHGYQGSGSLKVCPRSTACDMTTQILERVLTPHLCMGPGAG